MLALRSRLARALAALAALLVAPSAESQNRVTDLAIQSDASWIEVGSASGLWLDLPAPVGSVFLPFRSQGGGTASVRTALVGNLRVADRLDDFNPSFQVGRPATAITALASGSALPGLPGAETTAAPAALAVSFGAVGGLAIGSAALRDVSLELVETFGADPVATDRWAWPKGPFDGPLAPIATVSAIRGVADLDASFLAPARAPLSERIQVPLSLDATHRGRIDRSAGGGLRVVLPLRVVAALGPQDLATSLPVRLALDLSGRVVAQNAAFVPEPASAACVGAAVAALGALLRRREGARR